jgi:hypothetical protein
MADTTSLTTARAKLHDFPMEDLPNDPNSLLWTRIEEIYDLSLAEVSALMRASTGNSNYPSLEIFFCPLDVCIENLI